MASLQECCWIKEENRYYCWAFPRGEKPVLAGESSYRMRGREDLRARIAMPERGVLALQTDLISSPVLEARLLLCDLYGNEVFFPAEPLREEGEGRYFCNLSETEKFCETGKTRHFRLLLETLQDDGYHRYQLENREMMRADKNMAKEKAQATAFATIAPEEKDPLTVQTCAYLDTQGEWMLAIGPQNWYLAMSHVCHLHKLKLSGKGLFLFFEASQEDCECIGVFLRFRTKLERESEEYAFTLKKVRQEGERAFLEAYLPTDRISWKSLYWDVYVRFRSRKDGREFENRLSITYRYRLYLTFFYPGIYKGKDGYFLYPFNDASGMLAFKYRARERYDGLSFRCKEISARLIFGLAKPYWKKRHIRLVYEKFCVMAQDNGYYFFQYCMNHEKDASRYYYVIDRHSADRDKLLPYRKQVVDFLSIRHMVYLLAADLLISTDTRSHLYAQRCRGSLVRKGLRNKPFVFLQHGVTALKKVDFFYGKGKSGGCDLFVVTSDFEKDIVRKHFGYDEKEIVNSGFARWDVLEDKSSGSRQILIMPTWRVWLENATSEAFEQSDYYRNYMDLLNSPRFASFLEENDLEACFYLHSIFRDHIADFHVKSPRIRLMVFGEKPANELLMSCKLLVTDYSSVSWDVLYLGKPVLFYQFDRADYLEAHGSYLNLETDLFGPNSTDAEGLVEEMERCAARDFALEEKYAKSRTGYYKFFDDQNSRRICDAIRTRWG